MQKENGVLGRELEYHEKLYSGFAQSHFARPAVRALRGYMAARILWVTGANEDSRVLSLGCGIGDTELLLAPRVREVVGVDLSPAAVRQASADAARAGITNASFLEGSFERASGLGPFDVVVAVFLLHHLPDSILAQLPEFLEGILAPGGAFYSLDPSRRRLSGVVGRLCVPWLMRKYQSPDERELDAGHTAGLFRGPGMEVRSEIYDFCSSPLAGLFPGWRTGYLVARDLDDLILRVPKLRNLGSNFEIIARKSG